MTHQIDPSFLKLPLHRLADVALSRARELGVTYADFRCERIRSQSLRLRDGKLQRSYNATDSGFAVRVIHKGTWGFAAGVDFTPDAAVQKAETAVAVASICRSLNTDPVELAAEPGYSNATWISAYQINPFDVPDAEKITLLAEWSNRLLTASSVNHVDAELLTVQENKFYADTAGTMTTQQRVRIDPQLTAIAVDDQSGQFETMRTLAPPTGRGWEYLTGTGWNWDAELAEIPTMVAEKMRAPSVAPGTYALVIHPSNLWLVIHESVGHATELDRALGYEAAYAGTSFATVDKLGSLNYGSPIMTVTGDRTAEHGMATIGYDDEGVAAQRWDLVKDGILVGYQLDRQMATRQGFGRSNGCAFADSARHMPIQRMPNVSLQPDSNGSSTEELIAGVERGIYIIGDKSWSIDMQRYNFQFTGQRFYAIQSGRLVGQLRDVAYQATTTDFWGSLEAIGGPETYVMGGAFTCGKAQPGQIAPVSHGCPSAVFRGVRVLNAAMEANR